jgi:hypothetical protein
LFLGCDGIWERYGEDFVGVTEEFRRDLGVGQVREMKEEMRGQEVLKMFFNRNINPSDASPYGRDNMTAVLVQFKK